MSNASRKAWLQVTSDSLSKRFVQKYVNGEIEHGSDLGHVSMASLLNEMESEALDQLAYTAEIRRRFAGMMNYTPELLKIIMGMQQGSRLTEEDENLLRRLVIENNLSAFKYKT